MSWHAQLYRPLKPRDHAPTKADGPFMPLALVALSRPCILRGLRKSAAASGWRRAGSS
jgi:hypothetical protein